MKNRIAILFAIALFSLMSCKRDAPVPKPAPAPPPQQTTPTTNPENTQPAPAPAPKDSVAPVEPKVEKNEKPAPAPPPKNEKKPANPDDKKWVDLFFYDSTIVQEIRYATTNNFTKSKIYDCPRCLLRPEAAQALEKAHRFLLEKGYRLKVFDCFRPRPYQQRLWDKVPNANYVTPPAKGSQHSRGLAVDLTVVDEKGKELDMGTPYDFFGEEAHADYTKLSAKVLKNRKLLKSAMEQAGFKGIRTEWWHFSYPGATYPLSDYLWSCH